MSDSEKKVKQIIRLKRYEKPPEGFFEVFLEDFQNRREQLPGHRPEGFTVVERIKSWWNQVGVTKWMVGCGAAYAIVAIGMTWWEPKGSGSSNQKTNLSPVKHEPSKRPLEQQQDPQKKNQSPKAF